MRVTPQMTTLRRLLLPLLLALSVALGTSACAPGQLDAGLRTANSVAGAAACGFLAGQGMADACRGSSSDVLAALATMQQQQTELLATVAAQKTDPAAVAGIVTSLAALADAQKALALQLERMAEKEEPLPQYELPPLAPPPPKPTGAPVAPLPSPPVLSPAPPKPTPLQQLQNPLNRVY